MEKTQILDVENKETNSAQHFFLYMLVFLSLVFVIFGTGGILFQYVNKYFPDILSGSFESGFDQGAIKFGIAALFVAAPIFFILMRLVTKYLFSGVISELSKVRRWLTYIVLFFAAATIIGDLITLIVNFLEGDIPTRFLLKVLVVLILAGAVFGYYFWDIRKKNMQGVVYKENKIIVWVAIGFVTSVFISGFFIIDNPTIAREKKIDQQMVSDLQNIDDSIHSYFASVKKLPEKLDDLKEGSTLPAIRQGNVLTYEKTAENSYTLCATFVRSNLDDKDQSLIYDLNVTKEWQHESGRVCFKRVIEQQLLIK